ncbi:MAG TPA: CDP-alcohol phosphatidyltransferase family protein [Candidatus Acidoferrales bacterium]
MTPNQVTFMRVLAGFAAVAVFHFGRSVIADTAGVALTIAAIALDGLDGYLARTRNLSTPLGAQFDILGDRVVENLYFTFFAVTGMISLWVPIAFFARGATTDFLRSFAHRAGRAGFGSEGMLETIWGRLLVASRFSRIAYAGLKCICFCYLGGLLALSHLTVRWAAHIPVPFLENIGQVLTYGVVAICLLRAIPVLWEGRCFLIVEKQASARVESPERISILGRAR